MTSQISRRNFLRSSSLLGAGLAFGVPVLRGSSARTSAQDAIVIDWWDHYGNLPELQNAIWAEYSAAHPNVTVQGVVYNPADLGQSLQLAVPNGEAPDVHSIAGIGVPIARLVANDWFTPWDPYIDEEWIASLPPGALVKGVTVFNDQIYSIPIFSFRFHDTLTWFNKSLMESAGYDPEVGPRSWTEFRDAAKKITEQGGGSIFGWIQGIGFTERLAAHVTELAQAAGAPGTIDWHTGEYAYNSEPFVAAVEFVKALVDDGSLLPGSGSLDARTGRARWVTGVAGLFFDGPYNVGTVAREFPDFLPEMGVQGVIPPEVGAEFYVNRGPAAGGFFIASQSEHPDVAMDILKHYATPEFYRGVAAMMTPPPLDLSVVAEADVHPTYRQAISHFEQVVRLAPLPASRNEAVTDVLAVMAEVRPNLGEIVQGVVSGDVTDIRATLDQYNSQMMSARARAIEQVQADGKTVSQDDWVFPDWQPSEDYFTE